jgi:hypothetical protein
MSNYQVPFKSIKDHSKSVRGIHVDADYLYTWGPGYVPEGQSYPIDTAFIYDKQKSFEMDGMLVGFGQDINCVTSTDDRIVVGGGGGKDLTGYRYSVLRLYNKKTQLLEHDWGGDEYRVTSLLADEKYVYASTSDSTLIVHDKATMREIKTIYDNVDRSPETPLGSDSSRFFFEARDGSIQGWGKATLAREISLKIDGGVVSQMIVKDGIIYTADVSGNIITWNAITGAVITTTRACDGAVHGMTMFGQVLFTGDAGGMITGWDTRGFRKVVILAGGKGAIKMIKSDERYLYASIDGGIVAIWDIADVLHSNRS